jgi:hypothetical protein
MQTLLANAKNCQVLPDPFPHLIVEDALPEDLCLKLLSEYPALEVITNGAEVTSNQRFSIPASQTLSHSAISPLWQEFVRLHTSKLFYDQVLDLFGDHIRAMYPSLEKDIGALESLKVGIRNSQVYSDAKIALDAQICVNTSVVEAPSAVRRCHVDDPHKLFTGIYYLRQQDDTSAGGDLEFYRFKGAKNRFHVAEIDDRYVEVVKTIKYRRNSLVMFLNNIHALHGVTQRAVTPFPRLFFNLVGEAKSPLFDLGRYQESGRWTHLFKPLSGVGKLLTKQG